MYPADFRYTKEHEWIKIDGTTGTIGITDYAQNELGDVVFVELPKAGTQLRAGQPLGSIESVKAVSEIYSPASGEVIGVNDVLSNSPEKVNQEPHTGGWLIRLKLANAGEVSSLMDSTAYEAYIAEKAKEHSA
ncbi:MAG TPA: glycine cleavage system protein GcvH [Candidatus Acidoferrales bacterium]|nr:glycine cleavage system protein GcvH [Candidatus Acidoferrales bacterium]